jgi:hypothetical protein
MSHVKHNVQKAKQTDWPTQAVFNRSNRKNDQKANTQNVNKQTHRLTNLPNTQTDQQPNTDNANRPNTQCSTIQTYWLTNRPNTQRHTYNEKEEDILCSANSSLVKTNIPFLPALGHQCFILPPDYFPSFPGSPSLCTQLDPQPTHH